MILALERSTARGGAALLAEDGALVAAVEDPRGFQGDAYALVDAVLAQAGAPLADITRYAVGTGPGSFSGVRSAIAVLAGLALPDGGAFAVSDLGLVAELAAHGCSGRGGVPALG